VTRCAWAIAGVSALVFAFMMGPLPAAAQEQEEAAQEEAVAATDDMEGLPPLPDSPIEKAQKDGTALPLSLTELTKLALQNNLDIAIQDTNEELNQQRLQQAYGTYDPTLTSSLSYNSRKSPNTSAFDYGSSGDNTSKSASWSASYRQSVKTGGSFQASWNNGRSDSNSSMNLFNPSYSSSMSFQFTQPLLRNLRIDSNRNSIKVAKLDMQTSDSQFRQQVTNTISNIQTNYWSLVLAIRNYDIQRNSMRLAQINLRDNKKKLAVGTVAPLEVTDAEATVAQREVSVISAEEQILQAENNLRQLVSSDRNSDIWKKVIVPTDQPDFKEYDVDEDVAIETALRNRPELEQARITLENYDLQLALYNNNRKWQLDLTGQFGTSGTAGPQSTSCTFDTTTGTSVCGNSIKPEMVGGFGTVNKTLFSQGFINWQVGFSISVPLRNRQLDAQIAQQNIQKRRQLMTVRQQEQSIQVEVKNALRTLESNRRQVEVAGIQRKASQERLDGQEKRYTAGLVENFRVLEAQEQLSSAEYSELQALIRYKQAIITLQKAMYTLLEASEFEVAKGSSSRVPDLK